MALGITFAVTGPQFLM